MLSEMADQNSNSDGSDRHTNLYGFFSDETVVDLKRRLENLQRNDIIDNPELLEQHESDEVQKLKYRALFGYIPFFRTRVNRWVLKSEGSVKAPVAVVDHDDGDDYRADNNDANDNSCQSEIIAFDEDISDYEFQKCIRFIDNAAIGRVLHRGAGCKVTAAAFVIVSDDEKYILPVVLKTYVIAAIRRSRTAHFGRHGSLSLLQESHRVRSEVLLHATLNHSGVCPLLGVIRDDSAGLINLVFPRRVGPLMAWTASTCGFSVPLVAINLSTANCSCIRSAGQKRCVNYHTCSNHCMEEKDKGLDFNTLPHCCKDNNCKGVLVYSEKAARAIIKQIINVLSYLHSRRIIHKDIKPHNILITNRFCCCSVRRLCVAQDIDADDHKAALVVEECEDEREISGFDESDKEMDNADSSINASEGGWVREFGDFLWMGLRARSLPQTEFDGLEKDLQRSRWAYQKRVRIFEAGENNNTCKTSVNCYCESRCPQVSRNEQSAALFKLLRQESGHYHLGPLGKYVDELLSEIDSEDEDNSNEHHISTENQIINSETEFPRVLSAQTELEEGYEGSKTLENITDIRSKRGRECRDRENQHIFNEMSSDTTKCCAFSCEVNVELTDFNSAVVTDDAFCTVWDAVGSPHFVPPECLMAGNSEGWDGRARDMWAVGMTLYCMLLSRPPFWGCDGIPLACKLSTEKIRTPTTARLSAECIDLIEKLLEIDPKKRATLEEVQQHKWMDQIC